MRTIGFSVIYTDVAPDSFYIQLLSDMRAAGCDAIEIHTPTHKEITNAELLKLIGQFPFRALHTSDLSSAEQSGEAVAFYQTLARKLDAAAITIHPHTMTSWEWLFEVFGDRTSFENMDAFKPFGKTAEDMLKIIEKYPTARWTFDVNHVYTNDPSMQLTEAFYRKLPPPGHFHISGFKDQALPHTPLYQTKQRRILDAVATDAPIIIESFGTADIHDFQKELQYIRHSF